MMDRDKIGKRASLRFPQRFGLFVILRNNCNSRVMGTSNSISKKKVIANFLDYRHQMQPEIYGLWISEYMDKING